MCVYVWCVGACVCISYSYILIYSFKGRIIVLWIRCNFSSFLISGNDSLPQYRNAETELKFEFISLPAMLLMASHFSGCCYGSWNISCTFQHESPSQRTLLSLRDCYHATAWMSNAEELNSAHTLSARNGVNPQVLLWGCKPTVWGRGLV